MLALQLAVVVMAAVAVDRTSGHGMVLDPPNRSSMWRFGYNTPPNYNDNENFCGGFGAQHNTNGGQCGVCGDNWAHGRPRANENGGKYGLGIVVRRYKSGELIHTNTMLKANHWGWFEFRLCVLDGPDALETDECFDQHLLTLTDGSTRYHLPSKEPGDFPVSLKLPQGLTCERCVLQWHWRAANTWGHCEDGTSGVGCGPQETFRNCIDIAID